MITEDDKLAAEEYAEDNFPSAEIDQGHRDSAVGSFLAGMVHERKHTDVLGITLNNAIGDAIVNRERSKNLKHERDEANAKLAHSENELAGLKTKIKTVLNAVSRQAEDEGLWIIPHQSIVEAYLQQELRQLHLVIETSFSRLMEEK